MSERRSFDYGPRFGHLLLYALTLALFAVLAAVAALLGGETTTRSGVVLSEGQSTALFVVSGILFAAGAVWLLTLTEPDKIRRNTLAFGAEGIEMNRSGNSPRKASVPYDRIGAVRHVRNRKQEYLRIEFDGGFLALDRRQFNDRATFLAFKTALEERIALP